MQRLTGLDATFLYLETPTHHMHVAMTMVLDPSTMEGGYSFEKIRDYINRRIHLVPPFHRRLMSVPFNLAHPLWVDDPDFDIDNHIHRIACPAPGGRRELGEIAGHIASTPLNRSRPLWDLWVIEGLKKGRVGVVTKVHHSAIDGASGSEILVHLLSTEPDPPDPEAPAPREPDHIPNEMELLGHAVASRFRRTIRLPRLLSDTVGAVNRVVQGRRDPDTLVGAAPLSAPRTSWNGPLSTRRSVAFARVPLSEVKEVKNVFGCTVNDLVLALCAGTLRGYLRERDELPDTPLIATCPISVHVEGDGIGNKVSAMFATLATDCADPLERVEVIRQGTKGAKEEHKAVGADMLQNWAEYAGPNTFNLASRLYSSLGLAGAHRPVHNVIISNVPGPPFKLFYAGAEMVAAYPMGPTMEGVGLNVTVFSYQDSIDFGFMVDSDLVPDVWDMADHVRAALDELREAAGLPPRDASAGAASSGAQAPAEAPPATPPAAAKKAAARRAPAKKPAAKKAAAKKAPVKKAATAKKAAPKPATARKASATKTAAAKTAPSSRKAPAKKAPARKAPARKAPARRASAG